MILRFGESRHPNGFLRFGNQTYAPLSPPALAADISVTDIAQATAVLHAVPVRAVIYGIAVLAVSSVAPSVQAMLAGTVAGAVWWRSATAMSAHGTIIAGLEGLTAGRAYRAYLAVRDQLTGVEARFQSEFWTQLAPVVDTTPPQFLRAVSINGRHAVGFNVSFAVDEAGQYRIVVQLESEPAPTVEEVFSGRGAGGVAPVYASKLAPLVANAPTNTAVTDLPKGASYIAYVAVRDLGGYAQLGISARVDIAPPPAEPPAITYRGGLTVVRARQGETIDALCWRNYGRTAGVLEAVLAANPGLGDVGPVLPHGYGVALPEVPQQAEIAAVQLWD